MKDRTISVLVFTDGRDCVQETIASFWDNVDDARIQDFTIIDDSANRIYGKFLNDTFKNARIISHAERRGFAGAIQSGWSSLTDSDFAFHLEDDFTFNEPIPLDDMIKIIDSDEHIAQVALKRQPWGEAEIVAGGFMSMYPELWANETVDGVEFCWQRHFFTTNPSIYRKALTKRGWPQEEHSEQVFTNTVLKDWPEVKFAYYGNTERPPMVHHVGDQRVGIGY